MSSASLAARRDRALGAGAPLFYNTPLHAVRGEGVYLFDADGRRYLDMYNNVPCVGHANPTVVEAMTQAQGTLNVHSRYLHEGIVAFAERLAALHGPSIESVIFTCSGTEANEVALRMARLKTGKTGIVCTDATYHGNSEAVAKLNRIGAGRLVDIARALHVPVTSFYAGMDDGSEISTESALSGQAIDLAKLFDELPAETRVVMFPTLRAMLRANLHQAAA